MKFGEVPRWKQATDRVAAQRYTVPVHGEVVDAREYDFVRHLCRELADELSVAVRDATVLCHCYETDNRPPMDILKRYGKRVLK